MKKYISILLIMLVVLVGCGSKVDTLITSNDALEKIENKDSFIFYVGSKDCPACQKFSPTYEEVAQDFPDSLYSIELSKEKNSEDFIKLEESIGKITVTPTVVVIKDGVVVDKKQGALKYSELENFLERYEIAK